MKKSKLKLLVCYHKPDILVKDDIFTPIHVGRALAKKRMAADDPNLKWMLENTIGDDEGDNISEKNMSYNELTALYFAWKNYDKIGNPDYVGLCHYRRYFIFRKSNAVVETIRDIDNNFFNYIGYSEQAVEHLFDDCDYVSHIGKVNGIFNHYKENHHAEDLLLAVDIVKEKFPEYSKVADEYLKMSYGNFFNMFILPKKLFFRYCEWIFTILAEFEKRVDLSEKRLFISERLTGIFIEKLKQEGLKQKSLPVAFVDAPSRTPVAISLADSHFKTAVAIESILSNARWGSFVDFYVLHSGESQVDTHMFDALLEKYPNNSLTFVNVAEKLAEKNIDCKNFSFPAHYPLVVSEVIDKANKILYLAERTLFFGDIATFYRECNNDEFRVLGIKNECQTGSCLAPNGTLFCLHAGRLRNHKLIEEFAKICQNKTAAEVFEQTCPGQVYDIAWWNYSTTTLKKDGSLCYKLTRGNHRWENAAWKFPVLYYENGCEPWNRPLMLYSFYWWEKAKEIPSSIKFDISDDAATENFFADSKRICKIASKNRKHAKLARKKAYKPSIFTKAKWYVEVHGFKATVKRAFQKIMRRP